MQRVLLGACAVAVVVIGALAWPAQAQGRSENTLFDGNTIMYPGAVVTRCFDFDGGMMIVSADSPPGRTGESAFLDVTGSLEDGEHAYLRTLVTMAPIDARYSVEARYPVELGRYCFTLSVTKKLEEAGDPNQPERPNKQVYLTVKHRP